MPLGDESTKARAMASYELVQRIQERTCSEGAEKARERTGQTELGEKRNPPSTVAGNRCAIAKDEPPAFAAAFLRNGREQMYGLIIGERQQGQLFMSIEPGDDPRRPAAKLSAAGIEENGTRKMPRCYSAFFPLTTMYPR